jgi:hypothetical protein
MVLGPVPLPAQRRQAPRGLYRRGQGIGLAATEALGEAVFKYVLAF